MKQRYVLKNRTRFITFISALLLMFFTLAYSSTVYGFKAHTYTKITVRQGDSLWQIASRYSKDGDIRKYIYDIKELNNLTSSEIYEGSELVIPE